jgi:RNA polymerase sigma-70 factor (ECF subfamily)
MITENPLAGDGRPLAALIERCTHRDAGALEELYRLTAPTLMGCLMRILRRRALAEEALQDVFVQVWQRAAQFEEHRGRALAWLISMARYRAIDILRRERLDHTDPFEMAQRLESTSSESDATAVTDGDVQVLETCMGRLNDEQRNCIRLAFLAGRSHLEVAQLLQRPLGSVKSWIRRGLVALKECIEACSPRTAK